MGAPMAGEEEGMDLYGFIFKLDGSIVDQF
jgi:hypothetical protein